MRGIVLIALSVGVIFLLSSCSHYSATKSNYAAAPPKQPEREVDLAPPNYADRLPKSIATGGQKTIVIDPKVHAWGGI